MISDDRIKHMLEVARKARVIALEKYNLSEEEANICFVIGLLHDIGYEFGSTEEHNRIGAELLKLTGFKYWQEIANHGEKSDYNSLYSDILHEADLRISSTGEEISVKKTIRYNE